MPDLPSGVMEPDGWHGIINSELKRIRCPEHGEQDLVTVDDSCGCQDCAQCQREQLQERNASFLAKIRRRWFR